MYKTTVICGLRVLCIPFLGKIWVLKYVVFYDFHFFSSLRKFWKFSFFLQNWLMGHLIWPSMGLKWTGSGLEVDRKWLEVGQMWNARNLQGALRFLFNKKVLKSLTYNMWKFWRQINFPRYSYKKCTLSSSLLWLVFRIPDNDIPIILNSPIKIFSYFLLLIGWGKIFIIHQLFWHYKYYDGMTSKLFLCNIWIILTVMNLKYHF